MNRPNKKDYETKVMLDDQELKIKVDLSNFGYLRDLEKYCDELEKALDVLALYLTTTNECPDIKEECYGKDGCLDIKKRRNCWKEWALNVER